MVTEQYSRRLIILMWSVNKLRIYLLQWLVF